MNTTTAEATAASATSQQPSMASPPATPRFDLYANIHKALRAAMTEALMTVGRADGSDDHDTRRALSAVRDVLTMCVLHVDKENRYVHPAIEARARNASLHIAVEHDEHLQAIADLQEDVQVVEAANVPAREAALLKLYRNLSAFVAENFEHMLVEETAHNAALWACYSDAELHEIEGRILASIAPPEMMGVLRWMVPSITPAARANLFVGMRAQMPAPMFANILQFAKSHLDACNRDKLDRVLAVSSATA